MGAETHEIDWDGAVAALDERKLLTYLLDSRTVDEVIREIAEETGLPRLLVRVAVRELARLAEAQGKGALGWVGSRVAGLAKQALLRLPRAQEFVDGMNTWMAKLEGSAQSKQALNDFLTGTTDHISEEHARSLSDELKASIRTLGEIETLRAEIKEGFDAIMEVLRPQPRLEIRVASGKHDGRLRYTARYVPFVGRDETIAGLKEFLYGSDRFGWMLMTGAGGQGKSRAALELCLSAGTGWRSGFLPTDGLDFDWTTWQPERPTLIAIDYAAGRPEEAGRMLDCLLDRSSGDDLDAPVRVLLIEREKGDTWWPRLINAAAEPYGLEASFADHLGLPELGPDHLWAIIAHIMNLSGKNLPDRTETLEALAAIDPQGRPLFAAMSAEAMADPEATAGHGALRGWDRARLLRDVLDRDRRKFWPEPEVSGPLEAVLCLATLVGGIDLRHLPEEPEAGLPRPADIAPDAYARMARAAPVPVEDSLILPPLEPDILGEFFVLNYLDDKNPLAARQRSQAMHGLIWMLPPIDRINFIQTMDRMGKDFPAELNESLTAPPPNGETADHVLWAAMSVNMVNDLHPTERWIDRVTALQRRVGDAAKLHNDLVIWRLFAMTTVNLGPVDKGDSQISERVIQHWSLHGGWCGSGRPFGFGMGGNWATSAA